MRNGIRVVGLLGLVVAASSCGDVVRQSRSPMLLVVDSLLGVRGGPTAGTPAGALTSDVLTNVTSPAPCTTAAPCPTVFSDSGQVTFTLSPKDVSIAPTGNNQVTVTRYHVQFHRTDGRNQQGVDVPYAFDGALTLTISPSSSSSTSFVLVRTAAKGESPLVELVSNPSVLSAIADVTFYGQDIVGNDVSAIAQISVNFGNFGD